MFSRFLHFTSCSRSWDTAFFYVLSTVFLPLPGKLRSNLPLLRPTLSNEHLPLLLFLCPHGLLHMQSHSHAACIYPLHSFLFNLHGLTHTSFYTNQLLYQPAFTQTLSCTKHFLQKPTFTSTSFAKTHFYTNAFSKNHLYANQLLDKRAFTLTSFYTNQLFDQPAFTETAFCSNQLFQTSFYTNQLLHKPAFKFTQNQLLDKSPFQKLRKPPFTTTSFPQPLLWACRPKARGPAEC